MDPRRLALEAWRKEKGDEVKKPYVRATLEKNSRTEIRKSRHWGADKSLRRRRSESCRLREDKTPLQQVGGYTAMTAEERLAMQQAFQRDIDNTVAELRAEEAAKAVVMELESEEYFCEVEATMDNPNCPSVTTPISIPSSTKKNHRRRSSAYFVNAELAFQSSKIRYSLVNMKRRCRRSFPGKQEGTVEKDCFYLTPVRRTARRSRSIIPLAAVRGEPCFDSPTELQGSEGCKKVEVLPNEALNVMMLTDL